MWVGMTSWNSHTYLLWIVADIVHTEMNKLAVYVFGRECSSTRSMIGRAIWSWMVQSPRSVPRWISEEKDGYG